MDTQLLVRDVERYTQRHLAHYIEELRDVCAIDSDSFYKPGLDEMADWMARRMASLGMEARVIQREQWGNDVLGTLRGEGQGCVTLLGHIDTVYPVGTAAQRPLRVEDTTLYGPGVCDMKGCILSGLYALEALLAMRYRAFGEIRFLCVSDEEISQRHCADLMQRVCQDCQGALVLEAARANGDIVSARKGNSWYTLTARGRAAHAGVEPEKGRNAILEIAHQTLQLYSLHGWREGLTINPGVISGGTTTNVVPDFAQVHFDVRYLHTEDRIATEQRWQEMLHNQRIAGVELTLEADPDFKDPMVCTPGTLQLAERAQEIASLLGFHVNHVLTGGASDASFSSSFGVPTLDGLGPIGGRDHSPYEYLMADSVAPRTALLAGLITSIK